MKQPILPQAFATVPDPVYQRAFPEAHRGQIPVEFYPSRPRHISVDVLEIGPGRGDFLLKEAQECPERSFAAIEISRKRFLKLNRRIDSRDLKNVLLVYGDARLVLPRHFSNDSVGEIVILFPDPWPKRRHAFNRLLQPSFLADCARILKSGGFIHLKSDVESYVEWVGQRAGRIPQLRVSDDHRQWGDIRVEEAGSLSLYADRQTAMGYSIHSLCLQKT